MATLLSINNDEKVTKALKEVIVENHHELITFDSFYEGLSYAQKNKVDVIIINAMNEYKTPTEIVRLIKSNELVRETPILFTYDYFTKPRDGFGSFDEELRIDEISNIETSYSYSQAIDKLLNKAKAEYVGMFIPLDTLKRPYYESVQIIVHITDKILMYHWDGYWWEDPIDSIFWFEIRPHNDLQQATINAIKRKLSFIPPELSYYTTYYRYNDTSQTMGRFLYGRDKIEEQNLELKEIIYVYEAPFSQFTDYEKWTQGWSGNTTAQLYLATPEEMDKKIRTPFIADIAKEILAKKTTE